MLYLDAEALTERLRPKALIDALDRAFRSDVQVPARQSYAVGDQENAAAALIIMPAWQTNACIGVKLVTVFPNNSARGKPAVHATYTLFDAATGEPRAMLDGTELTLRRTAAASALAARYLALPEASRLLMVGTGSLAPHAIENHAAVRPIRSVRIWGRRPERANAVAKSLAGRHYEIEAGLRIFSPPLCLGRHCELRDARGGAAGARRVAAPRPTYRSHRIVHAADVARRTTRPWSVPPFMWICEPDALPLESGELVYGAGSRASIFDRAEAFAGELSELARGSVSGRRDPGEITLFKSVGCALEDLAAAELAVSA